MFKKNKNTGLWGFREAAAMTTPQQIVLLALIVCGVFSILRLLNWWFKLEHVGSVPLFIMLSMLFWYGMGRMVFIWINYLGIKKPEHKPATDGLRVAIFTTSSPGEPLSMFDKTLEACAKITYPHTTYLLDDTRDPRFKEVAEKHGAVWLEIVGFPGAKAGKINEALRRTNEDFILVLDPDHIPFPAFLNHTLGYFEDEKVGFVQVSQAYYNQYRSFTAAGAAEQTYGFYGPTQMGLNGYGCSVAIGANCTFRRAALASIGGHGIGLAEDLVTSIRLHAAGWTSVYNPVIVSRGLVPEDFGSFCKQQLKWARGVHEVLFAELPRLFFKLKGWQRLSYFLIGTYYSVGVILFFYLLLPFLYFFTGILPAKMPFAAFLEHLAPVGVIGLSIYLYVQNWMCHPSVERGIHWRGMVLKFACWPVFLMGFIYAIINRDIPYIPTAKKAVVGFFSPFAKPLVVHVSVFVVTFIVFILKRKYWMDESEVLVTSEQFWGMMGFAFIAVAMSWGGIRAALESLTEAEPWTEIDTHLNDNNEFIIQELKTHTV